MKANRTTIGLVAVSTTVLLASIAGSWRGARTATPASDASSTSDSSAAATANVASHGDEAEAPLAPMRISPERLQRINVSIGEVTRKAVEDQIVTTGNVAVDETRLAYIQVRFSGYIQKVLVDASYQYVRKGQPLFTIYSPDLVSTEREYLLAKQSQQRLEHVTDPEIAKDAASLVEAAAARLQQWNISRREIARLESTGEVQQNTRIDSPVSGYITERDALPNKYAQPDTRLYTVADLSTVWVFAQVFQSDLGRVKIGDPATVTVDTYPGRTFSGRVDFLYPEIDMTTRTARARLVFRNPTLELKPGMFVNVALRVPNGEHEVIPASAVLQTGTREIAFVDHGGGNLEPRELQLGARVGDEYIVLKGLEAGERIVTSANFLIDSESQLQAALGTFAPSSTDASAAAVPANSARETLELTTDPQPPRKGSNAIRVKLTAADGAPVSGAQINVTFFMPAMPAMGMAAMHTAVNLTDRGTGVYAGTAQLQSGGTWQVSIVAKKNDQFVASKQLSVSATGGM